MDQFLASRNAPRSPAQSNRQRSFFARAGYQPAVGHQHGQTRSASLSSAARFDLQTQQHLCRRDQLHPARRAHVLRVRRRRRALPRRPEVSDHHRRRCPPQVNAVLCRFRLRHARARRIGQRVRRHQLPQPMSRSDRFRSIWTCGFQLRTDQVARQRCGARPIPAGIVDYFCIWVLLVDDADRARCTRCGAPDARALRNHQRSSMPMCGCCYGCGGPSPAACFRRRFAVHGQVTVYRSFAILTEITNQRRSALADSRAS